MEAKTESEELVDKLVEAPTLPRPRHRKSTELIRMAKHVDAMQSLNLDATPEFCVKGSRDAERFGLSGRETESEVLSSSSRPLRDGLWRHNPDGPGLLGKPVNLGRPYCREPETNVPSNRQPVSMRGTNNELEPARRNESMNDPDSWGKLAQDPDGRWLGTDSDVIVNKFKEGRKELFGLEDPKGSLLDSSKRKNEKIGCESPDKESGELRERTVLEQLYIKGRHSPRDDKVKSRDVDAVAVSKLFLKKTQNRDLRKSSPGKAGGDFGKRLSPIKSVADFRNPSPGTGTGELRKLSPVKAVGDLSKPSPARATGDRRKVSPAALNAQKVAHIAQKEPQKVDQVVARDSYRVVSGSGKLSSSRQVDERPEGGSSLNSRASNDPFDRPMESRGVKRQLDDGSSEPPRIYKKSNIAPAVSSLSLTRGVSESGASRPIDRKQVSPDFVQKSQNSESNMGGTIEVPTNLAGPSGKASGAQRPLGRSQKSHVKQPMEPPRGCDGNARMSAGLLRPGAYKKKEKLQSGPGLSIGKGLNSSSPEEDSGKAYFVKYEKDAPDLRGPIGSPEEAEVYKKEYQIKYYVYTRLYSDLDKNGAHFHSFKREMLQATSHPDKLQQISTKLRREFHAIRKEFKRMQKTFDILHEELQTIKQHLRCFAGKSSQV